MRDYFNHKYPYTDFHELNLDWFLGELKKLVDELEILKTRMDNAEEDIDTLQAEMLDIQDRVALLESGLQDALDRLDNVESDIDNILSAISDMQDNIDSILSELERHMNLIRDCQDDISSIEDDINTRIDPALEDLRSSIDNLTLLVSYDSATEELTFSIGSEVQ